MLLGVSRPAMPTYANAAKFLGYAIAAPLSYYYFGILGALLAFFSAGEAIKYIAMWLLSRGHNLAFARDDLALSVLFLMTALLARKLLFFIGLTGDISHSCSLGSQH